MAATPSPALGSDLAFGWSTDWGHESGWFNDHHGEPVSSTKAAGALSRGLHLAGRRRSPG